MLDLGVPSVPNQGSCRAWNIRSASWPRIFRGEIIPVPGPLDDGLPLASKARGRVLVRCGGWLQGLREYHTMLRLRAIGDFVAKGYSVNPINRKIFVRLHAATTSSSGLFSSGPLN